MGNATFCLQPGGQTLTRAAFYQSIVYGCIPVVFREDFHFTHTLAFSETIPYKELLVHIPETSVLAGEDFVKTIQGLVTKVLGIKPVVLPITYEPLLPDEDLSLLEGLEEGADRLTVFRAHLLMLLQHGVLPTSEMVAVVETLAADDQNEEFEKEVGVWRALAEAMKAEGMPERAVGCWSVSTFDAGCPPSAPSAAAAPASPGSSPSRHSTRAALRLLRQLPVPR